MTSLIFMFLTCSRKILPKIFIAIAEEIARDMIKRECLVLESDRRHGEEVDRHQVLDVVVQEGTPRLRWRLGVPNHVLGHAGLTDLDAQFEQFPVDMGRTPQRVFAAHLADQIANLAGNASHPAPPDLPGPEQPESLAMPGDHRRRFVDVQRRAPVVPESGQQQP